MDEVNINVNSLIVLLQLLGFEIIYEPDSNGLPKLGDKEINLASKKCKIKLDQILESDVEQRESLVIPELKDQNKQIIYKKLHAVLDLISGDTQSEITANTEKRIFRRGSSFNVSKSFTVHHNVVVNMDTQDVFTSPLSRCASPVLTRISQTPSRSNKKGIEDILKKARNLIDLAMDMTSKLIAGEMGLNSTFTKDENEGQLKIESPRISNINKVSPLAEPKYNENISHLTDITNTSNISHVSAPNKLKAAFNKISTPRKKEVHQNESMERKWKRPFTRIGILKQPSNATGATTTRSSPLGRIKSDRVDTPRPIKCSSTSNLASPYLRPSKPNMVNGTNTPSPRFLRAPSENKITPGSVLRKPGWAKK